jgi:hypothetical protein
MSSEIALLIMWEGRVVLIGNVCLMFHEAWAKRSESGDLKLHISSWLQSVT